MTIDDLSHENSLIRARNERLEAEKDYLVTALRTVLDDLDSGDGLCPLTRMVADRAIEKYKGSAT